MTHQEYILAQLNEAAQTLNSFISDPTTVELIEQAAQIMVASLSAEGKLPI
jgi:phosphoheptose isomerase